MTQLSKTKAWMKANRDWLSDDTGPMTESLILLAESMDSEKATKGSVGGSLATAYRMAFRTLMEMKAQAAAPVVFEDDDLLSAGRP